MRLLPELLVLNLDDLSWASCRDNLILSRSDLDRNALFLERLNLWYSGIFGLLLLLFQRLVLLYLLLRDFGGCFDLLRTFLTLLESDSLLGLLKSRLSDVIVKFLLPGVLVATIAA